ncbi:MAG: HAD-IIIA family hydrolase [Bacteroidales bacterium]|jgi:histidinol-phosphate phosphatase family protein|nr:HAD-IIIA family hydrolase [Bacteroidales bacterium]
MPQKKYINRTYKTLFLDRDGVVNVRLIDDYVKTFSEFEFEKGALEAIKILSNKFERIVIVSNQQGVAKGLMSKESLEDINEKLKKEVERSGGRIDAIFNCTALEKENNFCRKPNVGMALKAKKQFSSIRFKDSVMVGDSLSDMIFGKRLNMQTIMICSSLFKVRKYHKLIDNSFDSLISYAKNIENETK